MKVVPVLLSAILLLPAAPGVAQVTTARYYAVITDASGAVVPGAKITITHDATGTVLERSSDDQGEAIFDYLRVGGYTLRVEAQGFKRNQTSGIELAAGQQVRQTIQMEIGAATESVQVEANVPLVNTVSSEQINSFEAVKVRELPLARRNFSNLLAIGTGVTYSGDSVRMNGIGKNGVAFSVDGTDAGGNPEGRNSSNYLRPNLIDIMSIEAIQEVDTVKGVP
ncbi:MAG: carboxypeptidase regulatory-like domain-containing protein, partial [Bryobacterales bacterium]|nr:carboxypeptidase regulatory-like domain-containing protein [Bryobacterales bacterium]